MMELNLLCQLFYDIVWDVMKQEKKIHRLYILQKSTDQQIILESESYNHFHHYPKAGVVTSGLLMDLERSKLLAQTIASKWDTFICKALSLAFFSSQLSFICIWISASDIKDKK